MGTRRNLTISRMISRDVHHYVESRMYRFRFWSYPSSHFSRDSRISRVTAKSTDRIFGAFSDVFLQDAIGEKRWRMKERSSGIFTCTLRALISVLVFSLVDDLRRRSTNGPRFLRPYFLNRLASGCLPSPSIFCGNRVEFFIIKEKRGWI